MNKKINCIIFEGLDNSGKTTIIYKLCKEFNIFLKISEPCNNICVIGKFIRKNILIKNKEFLNPESKMLLFSACRFEHINKINIKDNNNKIYLFDRSFLSMFAYNKNVINSLNLEILNLNYKKFQQYFNCLGIFFLKITPETSFNRNKDIYNIKELNNISERYEYLFNNLTRKYFKINTKIFQINAELSINMNYDNIKKKIFEIV